MAKHKKAEGIEIKMRQLHRRAEYHTQRNCTYRQCRAHYGLDRVEWKTLEVEIQVQEAQLTNH